MNRPVCIWTYRTPMLPGQGGDLAAYDVRIAHYEVNKMAIPDYAAQTETAWLHLLNQSRCKTPTIIVLAAPSRFFYPFAQYILTHTRTAVIYPSLTYHQWDGGWWRAIYRGGHVSRVDWQPRANAVA